MKPIIKAHYFRHGVEVWFRKILRIFAVDVVVSHLMSKPTKNVLKFWKHNSPLSRVCFSNYLPLWLFWVFTIFRFFMTGTARESVKSLQKYLFVVFYRLAAILKEILLLRRWGMNWRQINTNPKKGTAVKVKMLEVSNFVKSPIRHRSTIGTVVDLLHMMCNLKFKFFSAVAGEQFGKFKFFYDQIA